MKNFTLLLILMFGYMLNSQTTIPNPDFENWTGGNPDNWDLSNENIMGTQFTTCFENYNPQNGTTALEIVTVENNIFLAGNVVIPGVATLGDFVVNLAAQTADVIGYIPFKARPTSFKGWYKTDPKGGDKAFILVDFMRLNPITMNIDTIGRAKLLEPNTIGNWTQFNIPVVWTSPLVPDFMNIIVASSDVTDGNSTYIKDSRLIIDNLSFEYVITGDEEIAIVEDTKVYPNPVKDFIILEFAKEEDRTIFLVDITGRLLFETNTKDNITIDMKDRTGGVYLLNIHNPQKAVRSSIKLVK